MKTRLMTCRLSAFFSLLVFAVFVSACGGSGSEVAQTESAQPTSTDKATGVQYVVTPGTSVVMWEGYKPGRTHTGTVDIGSGELYVDNGQITGGLFSIDLTTITVTDLEAGKGKERLEAHLKGTTPGKENDFFNVNAFPAGSFEITRVTRLEGDEEANHMVYGNLKLKGISKNIGFRAQIDTQGNLVIVTTPMFSIDRTEWELNFRSGKFFDNLGDNLIRDDIGLIINLVAAAQPEG